MSNDNKQRIQKLLKNDPLLAVIFDTLLETILYTDSYLDQIVEKILFYPRSMHSCVIILSRLKTISSQAKTRHRLLQVQYA
ncbi:hypothetical protein SporoP37_16695 (plasmid) [Sporosarcina sp. P37]|nr:hypothetical protein SporoP37_16695 [Sporosarcina sp. P37]PID17638.1 hypothetical protein CSV62_12645 [Sporosarcina sp. P35]